MRIIIHGLFYGYDLGTIFLSFKENCLIVEIKRNNKK